MPLGPFTFYRAVGCEDLCPRGCKLREGQRGLCFVRARQNDEVVLTTYGRSSGFCVDPIEKKPLNHFLPGTPVLSLVYAPKLNSIIAGDADNRIHIIDVDTFQTTNSFAAHSSYIWDVSLSPNGEHLITSSSDFTAKIWDTEDWSLLHHLKGHEGEVASARYSSDGNWIVTASDDGTIRLWETDNYQTYKVLRGHNDSVWRAVFSPDGSKITLFLGPATAKASKRSQQL